MNLLGSWEVDETDARALEELGNVLLLFREGGGLVYTIRGRDKDQIILLRYRVEKDVIITDQPSSPAVERTQYSVSGDGILTLSFGGTPYRFKRCTQVH